MGSVFAVRSVKGGVGKTMVSLGLAMLLATKLSQKERQLPKEEGDTHEVVVQTPPKPEMAAVPSKVCYVDLDVHGSATALLFGTADENGFISDQRIDALNGRKTINSWLMDHTRSKCECTLEEMRVEVKLKNGAQLDFFLMDSHAEQRSPFSKVYPGVDPLDSDLFREGFNKLMGELGAYDYVVLDLPVGFDGLAGWVYEYLLTTDVYFNNMTNKPAALRKYDKYILPVSTLDNSIVQSNLDWYLDWLQNAPQRFQVMEPCNDDIPPHRLRYRFVLNNRMGADIAGGVKENGILEAFDSFSRSMIANTLHLRAHHKRQIDAVVFPHIRGLLEMTMESPKANPDLLPLDPDISATDINSYSETIETIYESVLENQTSSLVKWIDELIK